MSGLFLLFFSVLSVPLWFIVLEPLKQIRRGIVAALERRLVRRVSCMEITKGKRMRAPAFQGLVRE